MLYIISINLDIPSKPPQTQRWSPRATTPTALRLQFIDATRLHFLELALNTWKNYDNHKIAIQRYVKAWLDGIRCLVQWPLYLPIFISTIYILSRIFFAEFFTMKMRYNTYHLFNKKNSQNNSPLHLLLALHLKTLTLGRFVEIFHLKDYPRLYRDVFVHFIHKMRQTDRFVSSVCMYVQNLSLNQLYFYKTSFNFKK